MVLNVYYFKEAYNAALRVLNVKGTPLKNNQNYDKTERLMNFKENQTSITTAEWLLSSNDTSITTGSVVRKMPTEGLKARQAGRKYLAKRGLSLTTARKFHLGYLPNWQSPTAVAKSDNPNSIPKTPRLIIPTGSGSYIARDTRDDIPEGQKQYKKVKEGRAHIFNDQAGQRAVNQLKIILDNLGIENHVVNISRGYKDANEALVKNRVQFITDIDNTLKDPDNRLQGLLYLMGLEITGLVSEVA